MCLQDYPKAQQKINNFFNKEEIVFIKKIVRNINGKFRYWVSKINNQKLIKH